MEAWREGLVTVLSAVPAGVCHRRFTVRRRAPVTDPSMPDPDRLVTLGVDTHLDTHVAAVASTNAVSCSTA